MLKRVEIWLYPVTLSLVRSDFPQGSKCSDALALLESDRAERKRATVKRPPYWLATSESRRVVSEREV